MADDPFIDAHVHFWDHGVEGLDWAWLKPGFTFRKWEGSAELDAPSYLPPQFREEAAGAGVTGMVHVHAADLEADPVVETAWLQGVADADPQGMPDAIVGWASLDGPVDVAEDVLRRHTTHSRFRGIRDPGALQALDADASAAGIDVLAELGLSLELRRPHDDMAELARIAARWPTVHVVLSHGCLPLARTPDDLASWTTAMRALAVHPNVICKLSAVAGASDPDWTVASIRPWILAAVETFGPERCMLGSNWPVDRLFGAYGRLIDGYRQVAAELDPEARAALLHGTARRVYRID